SPGAACWPTAAARGCGSARRPTSPISSSSARWQCSTTRSAPSAAPEVDQREPEEREVGHEVAAEEAAGLLRQPKGPLEPESLQHPRRPLRDPRDDVDGAADAHRERNVEPGPP